MAAALPVPSKCSLVISLSDPVKLYGQFRIASILYQQGETAACECPNLRKKQYFVEEAKRDKEKR